MDKTIFLLRDRLSAKKVINLFEEFSVFSDLKPVYSKLEVLRNGVLTGVEIKLR